MINNIFIWNVQHLELNAEVNKSSSVNQHLYTIVVFFKKNPLLTRLIQFTYSKYYSYVRYQFCEEGDEFPSY